jgi:hypothetical protein
MKLKTFQNMIFFALEKAVTKVHVSSLGGKTEFMAKLVHFFVPFHCLTNRNCSSKKRSFTRHEKNAQNIKPRAFGKNIKGTKKTTKGEKNEPRAVKQTEKSREGEREKYVKINCKSIECDVKIKFHSRRR